MSDTTTDVHRRRKDPLLPVLSLGLRREELPVVGQDGEARFLGGKTPQDGKGDLLQARRPGQTLVQREGGLQGRRLQDDALPPQGRIEDEVGDETVRQDRVALLLRVEELDLEVRLRPDEAGQAHAVGQVLLGEEAPFPLGDGARPAPEDPDPALAARPAPIAGRVDRQPRRPQGRQKSLARYDGERKVLF